MKPCILVTGMHRSGTSFLSRACNLGGVYLGELDELMSHEWNARSDNLRGHWEHQAIFELGNEILVNSKCKWDTIPENLVCDEKICLQLKTILGNLEKPSSLAWGFKDPRLPIFYKYWHQYLPENIIPMTIFRHPLKVAHSLAVRNAFDYDKSIKLWNRYNKELLSMLETNPGFVFSFDWDKEKMIKELKMVFDKIGLCSTVDFNEWHTDELKHSDDLFDSSYEIPPETQRIYDKLTELSKNNANVNLKIKCNPDNHQQLTNQLYQNIQNQGIYFNKLYTDVSNLVELKKELEKLREKHIAEMKEISMRLEHAEKEILHYKQRLSDIYNSITWKMLRLLDKITHRSQ